MQRRKRRARRHEGREGGVEWVEIGGYKKDTNRGVDTLLKGSALLQPWVYEIK